MPQITLPHSGWRPRKYQEKLWNYLESGGRRAIECAHRRWGKDDVALHFAAVAAHQRVGNIWHCLPLLTQARKALWTAVNPHTGKRRIDEAFPHELRAATNEQEMFIRFKNGSTWQVIGSDHYDSLVGSPPVALIFSEWARANPAAWSYLSPILLENNGTALFISTPLGKNHCHDMLRMAQNTPGWFAEVSTVADTGALSVEAVELQRTEYRALYGPDAGDALIEQEYYCSFSAAIMGSYFGAEIATAEREGRIGQVDINPDLPVHTSWDLGVADSTSLWCFQIEPPGEDAPKLRVVDYYESSGQGMKHYVDWLKAKGYNGCDVVPADIKNREFGSGRSRFETMTGMGRTPKIALAVKLADGIEAARQTIGQAQFDLGRCEKGLEALRQYQREWDEEARVYKKTPKHDWCSHAADSWRYLSLAWRTPLVRMSPEERIAQREIRHYEQLHGPTPIAVKEADGIVRIGNLESPMGFVKRMERKRRMMGYR